jgi:hypothetical protein
MGRSRNPCTKNLIINSTLGSWQAWSGISLPCPADEHETRLRFYAYKNLKPTKTTPSQAIWWGSGESNPID